MVLAMPAVLADIVLQHVEPPHWYRGFAEPSLQLMLHGDGIGGASVAVDGAGVTLERVEQVDNPNYLFVYLTIAAEGDDSIRLTLERDGVSHEIDYPLQPRQPRARGFDASDVIYLVMPDRFANGDPSNDVVADYPAELDRTQPDARHGGDLAGLLRHLDYIADMGFTQLWLNPVLENRMERGSYHGYATTDFYAIDPRYGSRDLYVEMAEAARDRGIGLIKDMIVNHIGTGHWWMADLPTADWLNSPGPYRQTTHARTTLQDPYAAADDIRAMADGWFVPTMPDLNQRQPLLADYLIQNALWWIEVASLTGIRMDTYPYPDKDFMAAWSRRIMVEYPDFGIVGEEWSANPVIVSYWQRGRDNFDGYESALPSVMDFPLQEALRTALTKPEAPYQNVWTPLYEVLANDHLYPEPMALVIFGDNHDMSRLHTQLGEDVALTRMALAILATMRGIPQVFYGTEILLANPDSESHGVIRADYPGGWPDDPTSAFTGNGLDAAARDLQAELRHLLRWRRTATAVHTGKLQHYTPAGDVYVYFRYDDESTVMVALNRGDEPVDIQLARFHERIDIGQRARDVMTDKEFVLGDTLSLGTKAARILEIRR